MNQETKKKARIAHAHNSAMAMQYMFRNAKIKAQVTKIWRGARYWTFDVRLLQPEKLDKALNITESIALGAGAKTVIARRESDILRYDLGLPKRLWDYYSTDDITPELGEIGLASGRVPVSIRDNAPNRLVLGEPGSGKSVALKSILYSLQRMYSPDELKMALVDPHRSIVEFDNTPHMLVNPVHEPADISNLISYIHSELYERKAIGEAEFVRSGQPRLLLVLDETSRAEVLGTQRNPNTDNLRMLADIVQEGRKFQINTILSSQKVGEMDMPGIYDVIGARYIGQVSSARLSSQLGGRAKIDAHMLTGSGDFVAIEGEDVKRFQFAMPEATHFNRLDRVEVPALDFGSAREYEPRAEAPKGGRPSVTIEPATAAYYYVKKPTQKEAKEALGFGRVLHKRYKDFVADFKREVEKIL